MTVRTGEARPVRFWRLREGDLSVVPGLQSELGLLPITARLLALRGYGSVDAAQSFLEPSLDQLESPFSFHQMEVVVDRLGRAIRAGETIVIHGDYDADGICGTVLLVIVLRALGAQVEFILPHRFRDGYGLQPASIDRACDIGGSVVVSVDCGITAHEAAERARKRKIDLIVLDHHTPIGELPEVRAIINPRVPDSGYPEIDLAAVGVAFKVARALLESQGSDRSGLALLKLVAIGTIADLVPLKGENRVMVCYGLRDMSEVRNPGLRWLMRTAGVRPPVSSGDVGFRLAPRINAAGRIGDPTDAAELFLTRDDKRACAIAEELGKINVERQRIEAEVTEKALKQPPKSDDVITVAVGEGWHRGVIGIVASQLVRAWERPALVLSVQGGVAHGSARSVPGFDIVDALGAAAHLYTEYGGHKQAAGVHLAAGNVASMREALREASRNVNPEDLIPPVICDGELGCEQISSALALELERLAPFGVGNPRPRFICQELRLTRAPELLKEQHVKMYLDGGGQADIEAVGWRRGDLVDQVGAGDRIQAVVTVRANRWGGRMRPQLELEDVCVA